MANSCSRNANVASLILLSSRASTAVLSNSQVALALDIPAVRLMLLSILICQELAHD